MPSLTHFQVRNSDHDKLVLIEKVKASRERHSSANIIPTDYADLFREYYQYVTLLVRKAGIPEIEAEDVAMSILMTFMEKGALEDYDPERIVVRNGVERTAAFRTFLSGFVLIYVRHYRERIQTRSFREGFSTETVMYVEGDTGTPVTYMDLHAPVQNEGYDDLMAEDLIVEIREHIGKIKPRNGNDRMDLTLFFDVILDQIQEHDEVRPSELAEMFGINRSTTFNWLRSLRKEIALVVEARSA